jgi:formylmethanofuran dehydrogenase subunit E
MKMELRSELICDICGFEVEETKMFMGKAICEKCYEKQKDYYDDLGDY